MICGVCCEKYNKSTHSKITCEFAGCGYEACKICIRTYLLGTTNDPPLFLPPSRKGFEVREHFGKGKTLKHSE